MHHVKFCSNTNSRSYKNLCTRKWFKSGWVGSYKNTHVCVRGNSLRISVRYIAARVPTMHMNTYIYIKLPWRKFLQNMHICLCKQRFDWELRRILLVRMADLKDERGNRIYLTDQQGKAAQLVDELGNAMYVTGVATTVPHLKESSYSGPHPITAPITTTDTPHHAQPISVSHNPVEEHGISSSNSVRL